MRTLPRLSLALLLCAGLSNPASAVGTNPNPITCPSSSDIWSWPLPGEFPLATRTNADGSTWYFGAYVYSQSSGGWQEGIFRRLYDASNAPTSTCYDATPSGYGYNYLGWAEDEGWYSTLSVGDDVGFTTFDGTYFLSSDAGVNWTVSTCHYSAANGYSGTHWCPAAPSTTTSCFSQHLPGGWVPLTCAAGSFCVDAGYMQGHHVGQCHVPCTFAAGHDDCGCVVKVDPDSYGDCPSGWLKETADGQCILEHTSSTCYGP